MLRACFCLLRRLECLGADSVQDDSALWSADLSLPGDLGFTHVSVCLERDASWYCLFRGRAGQPVLRRVIRFVLVDGDFGWVCGFDEILSVMMTGGVCVRAAVDKELDGARLLVLQCDLSNGFVCICDGGERRTMRRFDMVVSEHVAGGGAFGE